MRQRSNDGSTSGALRTTGTSVRGRLATWAGRTARTPLASQTRVSRAGLGLSVCTQTGRWVFSRRCKTCLKSGGQATSINRLRCPRLCCSLFIHTLVIMSEEIKKVEETPVAEVAAEAPATTEPVAEPVVEAAAEPAAETAEPVAEPAAEPAADAAEPAATTAEPTAEVKKAPYHKRLLAKLKSLVKSVAK